MSVHRGSRYAVSSVARAQAEVATRRLRTLVVDDSDTSQQAVCALMEMEPFVEVIGTASNGVEAIAAVASLHPDLVIMDVNMPYLDGLKAASILARHYPHMFIVLMSSENAPELQAATRRYGADAFVPKENLVAAMHAALRELF